MKAFTKQRNLLRKTEFNGGPLCLTVRNSCLLFYHSTLEHVLLKLSHKTEIATQMDFYVPFMYRLCCFIG